MSISKIVGIFSIVIISCCILLGFLANSLYKSSVASNKAVEQEMALNNLVAELSVSSTELTRLVRLFAVTGNPQAEIDYLSVIDERSGKTPRKVTRTVAPGENVSLTDLMIRYGSLPEELEKVALANQLSNTLVALETEAMYALKGTFKDSSGQYTIESTPDQAHAISLVFSNQYAEELTKIQKPLGEFFVMLQKRSQSETIEASNLVYQNIILLALIISLVLVLVLLFAWYTRYKLCLPLARISDYVKRVSSGNLKEKLSVTGKNEIGTLAQGLSTMVKNIVQLLDNAEEKTREVEIAMQKTKESAQAAHDAQNAQLAEASRRESMLVAASQLEEVVKVTSLATSQLFKVIDQSEKGAEEQALHVSNTAREIAEMNLNVIEVVESAGSAADISSHTREKADGSTTVVKECITAINSAKESTDILKEDMNTLAGHARAISQIMVVISDIADQTNLLALNAAIEAARAGDAGRGFAVVADEVRKLAEKTMASTTDVEKAIRSIQQSTDASMKQVEDAVQHVTIATEMVEVCGKSLSEIVTLAESTAEQVQGIATASEHQSTIGKNITLSMTEVDEIAEKTSDSMQEASQAVIELSRQADQLTSLITNLKQL